MGTVFRGTVFRGTVFRGTVFRGTVFRGTVFRGTVFRGTYSVMLYSRIQYCRYALYLACLSNGISVYSSCHTESFGMLKISLTGKNVSLFHLLLMNMNYCLIT